MFFSIMFNFNDVRNRKGKKKQAPISPFFQFSEADEFDIPELLAHWNSLFDIYFYFDKSLMLSVRDEWKIFIKG